MDNKDVRMLNEVGFGIAEEIVGAEAVEEMTAAEIRKKKKHCNCENCDCK